METLANLESFVRGAETGSFSAAARRLSLTPAAVSRNVAMLERNLGIRLFQRSTRKLTLTEAGERFLDAIRNNLDELQAAIASVATLRLTAAGVRDRRRAAAENPPVSALRTKDSRFASVSIGPSSSNDCK